MYFKFTISSYRALPQNNNLNNWRSFRTLLAVCSKYSVDLHFALRESGMMLAIVLGASQNLFSLLSL